MTDNIKNAIHREHARMTMRLMMPNEIATIIGSFA